MPTTTTRNNYFDNIKALLIILVVLGHLMERFLNIQSFKLIYILIYSFHMPLFIFVSGYFANTDNKKIVKRLIYPYIIFQILYLLFNKYILNVADTIFTFTTPYWLLWYLLSSILWSTLVQFIKNINLKVILVTFIIGLIAGLDNSIGYYLSLSRTIVFFPFFLLGYYCRNYKTDFNKLKENKILIAITSLLSVIAIIFLYINCNNINVAWLYSSTGYEAGKYNLIIRLIIYSIAIILSAMIIILTPKFKIPFVSNIGVNCMSIFLLHGFIVRYLGKAFPFELLSSNLKILIYLIIVSIIVVVVLSSKYIVNTLSKILPR